jgi:hypothetical protein
MQKDRVDYLGRQLNVYISDDLAGMRPGDYVHRQVAAFSHPNQLRIAQIAPPYEACRTASLACLHLSPQGRLSNGPGRGGPVYRSVPPIALTGAGVAP